MRFGLRSFLLTAFLLCFGVPWAIAGPPFLTDDPEPVDFKQSEFYIFSVVDRASDGVSAQAPGFEFNYGAAKNLHLHIIAPLQLTAPFEGPRTYGIGDIELGAKYRFIEEKGHRPMVGTFVMIEAPAGDVDRGLGNGTTIVKLPIWIQKGWGHGWQTYFGGGYLINSAPAARDTAFFGWQVQKGINKKLTLGGEWFNPGNQEYFGQNFHLLNFGGLYNFGKNFSLLFSGGHSVQGPAHTVGYLGLYWTWGKKEEEEKKEESKLMKPMTALARGMGIRGARP